jgi:hydrogenase expression/formation protein HypE
MKEILLNHGSGGKLTHNLVNELFVKTFSSKTLSDLEDSAILKIWGQSPKTGTVPKLAYTTDSYVVKPIFFKGGDIGKLSVCGTVNDLSCVGAKPLYITVSFIIEEGLPVDELKTIVNSIKNTAKTANVEIVAGDTKVVEKGKADKIFINTSGIGIIGKNVSVSCKNAKFGDLVLINGSIADHGIAVLSEREGIKFKTNIKSDVSPLNSLVSNILKVSRKIHVLRDPTRGGLATTLNEIAASSNVSIEIDEDKIPIKDEVKAASEILGFDPLYIANEGKMIVIVDKTDAQKALKTMKKNKYGKGSAIIGKIFKERKPAVYLKTSIGGTRIVDMLTGEQLPRIC